MKFNVFKSKDKKGNPEKDVNKNTEAISEEPNVDIAAIVDVTPEKPHGPAGELSIDTEEENSEVTVDEIDENKVEVKPSVIPKENLVKKSTALKTTTILANGVEPAVTQPVAATPPVKPEESGTNDLNSLFSMEEDEENPLAALIASLPDVTVRELLDDLDEIHRIIKEWKPNQGGGGIPR
jgi:hypothetical protein